MNQYPRCSLITMFIKKFSYFLLFSLFADFKMTPSSRAIKPLSLGVLLLTAQSLRLSGSTNHHEIQKILNWLLWDFLGQFSSLEISIATQTHRYLWNKYTLPKQAEIMAQGHVCCNTDSECRLCSSCRRGWGENIVFETVFRNIQQDWKQAEGMCDYSDVRNETLILKKQAHSIKPSRDFSFGPQQVKCYSVCPFKFVSCK